MIYIYIQIIYINTLYILYTNYIYIKYKKHIIYYYHQKNIFSLPIYPPKTYSSVIFCSQIHTHTHTYIYNVCITPSYSMMKSQLG